MKKWIAGRGGARTLMDIEIERLHLDPENPRLRNPARHSSESQILKELSQSFSLIEIALSMSQNGYLDEEPLVAVPIGLPNKFKNVDPLVLRRDKAYGEFLSDPKTEFIVIEGNRRLATAKILASSNLRRELAIKEWPNPKKEVLDDLKELPVVIYPERYLVVPYLGVKHIVGVKKWEPYAKARYIYTLVKNGQKIDEIQQKIGDKEATVLKYYIAYLLVEQMESEVEASAKEAKTNFSFIYLALGQAPVKNFLGMPKRLSAVSLKQPVSKNKIKNLIYLFSFLYGDGNLGPVIGESRDITGKLTNVLRVKESTALLIASRNLDEAYELSEGEEEVIHRKFSQVNRNLEYVLGRLHRYNKDEILKEEFEKIKKTLAQIEKQLGS